MLSHKPRLVIVAAVTIISLLLVVGFACAEDVWQPGSLSQTLTLSEDAEATLTLTQWQYLIVKGGAETEFAITGDPDNWVVGAMLVYDQADMSDDPTETSWDTTLDFTKTVTKPVVSIVAAQGLTPEAVYVVNVHPAGEVEVTVGADCAKAAKFHAACELPQVGVDGETVVYVAPTAGDTSPEEYSLEAQSPLQFLYDILESFLAWLGF